ncbi:hypothetical protein L1049_014001 [Liquidambar formosana]|uniref:Zinc knuckle CX2CX4HX4C domain-containing protein n=1 Tax=Liquidambar formosana TaxID=63359 RepID=A0AAP0WZ11_LIQFO
MKRDHQEARGGGGGGGGDGGVGKGESSSMATGKGKMWEEEQQQDASGMDEIQAVLGYKLIPLPSHRLNISARRRLLSPSAKSQPCRRRLIPYCCHSSVCVCACSTVPSSEVLGGYRSTRISKMVQNYVQIHSLSQVWIRIYGLSQEYWSKQNLMEIARGVGIPCQIDRATLSQFFGHYARILVELNLTQPLPECIRVEHEGHGFFVDVRYENLPPKCSHCNVFGHDLGYCRFVKHVGVHKDDTVVGEKPKAVYKPQTSTMQYKPKQIANVALVVRKPTKQLNARVIENVSKLNVDLQSLAISVSHVSATHSKKWGDSSDDEDSDGKHVGHIANQNIVAEDIVNRNITTGAETTSELGVVLPINIAISPIGGTINNENTNVASLNQFTLGAVEDGNDGFALVLSKSQQKRLKKKAKQAFLMKILNEGS